MSVLSQTSQTHQFSIRRELSIGNEIESMWNKLVHHQEEQGLDVQSLSNHKKEVSDEDGDSDTELYRIRPTQMTFEEVVADKGFELETHSVRTEDGYLLKVFRVRDKTTVGKKAKAIFMQHGFLASAGTFMKYAQDDTPIFNMAREGYDVWVGNNRGQLYTHENNKIDPIKNPKEFHDFSFQDLGKYDLPVQIDLVLKTTGLEKLTYLGHSQGTSQMFWALANDQDYYLSRVNAFVALAPVANMAHVSMGLKFGVNMMGVAQYIAEKNNFWSLFNPDEMDISILGKGGAVLLGFVNAFTHAFLGHEPDPKESSTKEAWHYGQIIKHDGIFAEYSQDNDVPGKKIHLENITKMPIWLFCGTDDPLATYKDNLTNQKALGNVKKLTLKQGFGHSDFLKAKNADFQQELVDTINKINGKTSVEQSLF